MTLSPVVTHTAETVQQNQLLTRAISSPFKNVASGHTSSSNGTPRPPAPTTYTAAQLPATLDLAEQMNDEEKRKWVKGKNRINHRISKLVLILFTCRKETW
jgi:cyclin-dependent kinase 7